MLHARTAGVLGFVCAAMAIGGTAGTAAGGAVREGVPVKVGQRSVLNAVARPAAANPRPVNRGSCPTISTTRFRAPRPGFSQDFDFDNIQQGQQLTIQQGFVEGEICAQSYQIPDSEFPIKMERIQAILGTVATVPTTTRWTVMLWDGPPTGAPLYEQSSDSSDPAAPPDASLPATPGGTNAAILDINFIVDSQGDPTLDWVIPAIGNPAVMHTVTIGFRIDQHNDQTGACSAPGGSNAFWCTEPGTCCTTNLLTFPNDNWLSIVACPGGCPAGWHTFQQLEASSCFLGFCLGCRPSGDLALRLQYSSQVCLPAPTGACCATTGQCTAGITDADCTGDWFQGQTCSPNPCPQPSGACCTNGVCSVGLQSACTGTFQGVNTTCTGINCPAPTGACCFGSSCQTLDSTTCGGFGGTFIGAGIACGTSGNCPLGACCLATGVCIADQSQPQCLQQSGTFRGVGTTCSPNNCPQPTGACCNTSSGFCGLLTQAACGGIPSTVWQGPLTTCDPNPCAQSGACCNATACTITSSAACTGQFQGNNTACGPTGNPTTCCPANFNDVGGVTVQDIFDFLAAYFASSPAADFNASGGVTVQDIFDFLGAYFTGCPS